MVHGGLIATSLDEISQKAPGGSINGIPLEEFVKPEVWREHEFGSNRPGANAPLVVSHPKPDLENVIAQCAATGTPKPFQLWKDEKVRKFKEQQAQQQQPPQPTASHDPDKNPIAEMVKDDFPTQEELAQAIAAFEKKAADYHVQHPDNPDPYTYQDDVPPEAVAAIQHRLGPQAVVRHPEQPDTYIHHPENHWDGPTHVKDHGDGTYSFDGWGGPQSFGSKEQQIRQSQPPRELTPYEEELASRDGLHYPDPYPCEHCGEQYGIYPPDKHCVNCGKEEAPYVAPAAPPSSHDPNDDVPF